jgi:hypothetical protein
MGMTPKMEVEILSVRIELPSTARQPTASGISLERNFSLRKRWQRTRSAAS